MPISILLADPSIAVTKGLQSILQDLGYSNVASVHSCKGIVKAIRHEKYTHLITETDLSDGSCLQLIPSLYAISPRLKVMLFSMHPRSLSSAIAKKLRMHAYAQKNSSELGVLSTELRMFLEINRNRYRLEKEPAASPLAKLSPAELIILPFLLSGLGSSAIARKFNLKQNTVSTVKGRIFEKTGAHTLDQLKLIAMDINDEPNLADNHVLS